MEFEEESLLFDPSSSAKMQDAAITLEPIHTSRERTHRRSCVALWTSNVRKEVAR